MKVLSLEEIQLIDINHRNDPLRLRLLHTAREYHRLRKALNGLTKECERYELEMDTQGGAGPRNKSVILKAREALKETETNEAAEP